MAWTQVCGPGLTARNASVNEARHRGSTLLELMIVVALLTLLAAVALPGMSATQDSTLDVATAEVVAALRFAHSEAIRTGTPFGVEADKPAQRVRVYRLDTSSDPATPVYDVRHPLTRQPYNIQFSGGSTRAALSSVSFKFDGSFLVHSSVDFAGGTGLPRYDDSGTVRMLTSATIDIAYGGRGNTVVVSPMTARITVQ